MKVSELSPKAESKLEFHLQKIKFFPTNGGCYVLTNFFQDVMYIGQSHNILTRIKQHLDNIKKTSLTELGVVYYVYYRIIDDVNKLNKLERGWLNHFELVEGNIPLLNSVRAPI